VNAWLRGLGIFGQRSYQKRVPEAVFRLSNEQIGHFLQHLWATDGSIHATPFGRRRATRVYYSTTSRPLAEDVAALLLRLGIVTRIRTVRQGDSRPSHTVDVSGVENQRLFLDRVGSFGPRREAASLLAARLAAVPANTNVDTVPSEWFETVKSAMRVRGISHRRMATLRQTAYGGSSHFRFSPSRALLAEYAVILEDEDLAARAASDLFWDRLVAVEPAGEEEVFDLTVPGPASWLADGIVSHNSGAIEQDADLVAFLYRDEYYNGEESDQQGIAEVILAKHRNGPTDTVKLSFLKRYAKFSDLAAV
jgi:replicative DNA helicase